MCVSTWVRVCARVFVCVRESGSQIGTEKGEYSLCTFAQREDRSYTPSLAFVWRHLSAGCSQVWWFVFMPQKNSFNHEKRITVLNRFPEDHLVDLVRNWAEQTRVSISSFGPRLPVFAKNVQVSGTKIALVLWLSLQGRLGLFGCNEKTSWMAWYAGVHRVFSGTFERVSSQWMGRFASRSADNHWMWRCLLPASSVVGFCELRRDSGENFVSAFVDRLTTLCASCLIVSKTSVSLYRLLLCEVPSGRSTMW